MNEHVLFWIGSLWAREALPEKVVAEHEKTCVNSRCILKKRFAPLGAELTRDMSRLVTQYERKLEATRKAKRKQKRK